MNTDWTPCFAYSRKHFFALQKVENTTDKLEYLDQVLKRKIGSLLYIRLCVSVQIDRRRKTENGEELWRPSFLCCCCCFLLLKSASSLVSTAYNTAINTQSLYNIPGVPQCLSPCLNWDLPPPLPQASVYPHPGTKGGGGHSPAGEGVGVPIRTTVEKPSILSTLWIKTTGPSPIPQLSLSSLSFFVVGNVCISKPTTTKSNYFFAYFFHWSQSLYVPYQ
jgi:hypothetical protein